MTQLEKHNLRVEEARAFYRNYINQYCDQNGSMRSASMGLINPRTGNPHSHDFIQTVLGCDNFMALKRLANKIKKQR